MAAVESSLTQTIDSFIHERGSPAGGLYCLLNMYFWGRRQTAERQVKSWRVQTLFSLFADNETNSISPTLQNQTSLQFIFASLLCMSQQEFFFVFCAGESEGTYSRPSANHSINYIFVLRTVLLSWNATIPVLPQRGGRVDGCSERPPHPAYRKEVRREHPPSPRLLILKWTPY